MNLVDVMALMFALLLTVEGLWLFATGIRKPNEFPLLATPRIRVCIIFPSYRDKVKLDEWLRALYNVKADFVIVEDGSRVNECWSNIAIYIHRDSRRGYKAGALNTAFDFLVKNGKEYDWVLIFDADHIPYSREQFISFLNWLETAPCDVVQAFWLDGLPLESWLDWLIYAGRYYSNINLYNRKFTNLTGSALAIRYRLVKEGLRFPESITEDYALTLDLLEKGIRVRVVGYVLSIGRSPASLRAFIKQQIRWAEGTIRDTITRLRKIWNRLIPREKLELMLHTNMYMQGVWLLAALLTVPFASSTVQTALAALSLVQAICYLFTLAKAKKRYFPIYFALIYLMIFIQIYALIRALTKKSATFTRTEKRD